VTARKVRFTKIAASQADRLNNWWHENRDETHLFNLELEEAITFVSGFPSSGTRYGQARLKNVFRVFLERVGCHLYYTFDDEEVIVRSIWGARRRRGPRIEK